MAKTESLLEEMRSIQNAKRIGATCSVSKVMENMPEDESAALRTVFSDSSIDSMTIEVWLGRKGHALRRHTISRHRRGECTCQK